MPTTGTIWIQEEYQHAIRHPFNANSASNSSNPIPPLLVPIPTPWRFVSTQTMILILFHTSAFRVRLHIPPSFPAVLLSLLSVRRYRFCVPTCTSLDTPRGWCTPLWDGAYLAPACILHGYGLYDSQEQQFHYSRAGERLGLFPLFISIPCWLSLSCSLPKFINEHLTNTHTYQPAHGILSTDSQAPAPPSLLPLLLIFTS
ncbi:hypothetical protein C8J57DRAFT_1672034 [Mycena rebaudengoi]|nr:hypothetical protein C8J57DRAFT_1672034 [Mycena rebaudengoi]